MISITAQTSKKELLENLTKEATNPGNLYIEIQSLPHFLATPIAFTVFTYQISNYPRTLAWYSNNLQILSFLRSCGIQITPPPNQVENQTQVIAKPQPSKTLIVLNPAQSTAKPSTPALNVKSRSLDIGKAQVKPALNQVSTNLVNKEKPVADFNALAEDGWNYLQQPQLKAEDLLKDSKYHPSLLIDKNQVEQREEIAEREKSHQNLDNWIKRIESAKQALNGIQNKDEEKTNIWQSLRKKSENKPENKAEVQAPNFAIRPKVYNLLAWSLAATMVFVLFIIIFPTKNYTIEVSALEERESLSVTVSPNTFSKQTVQLQTQSEADASGQKQINTSRASGKVVLINKSGNPIRFDRNGIILVAASGLEYEQLADNSFPGTVEIPARSDRNGGSVEITVQARREGSSYNLKENNQLKIYNLKNQAFGSLFQAFVSSEIKDTKLTGEKIVSEADYSLLRTQAESDLDTVRANEIKKLQNEKIFTNINWYKNLNSDYKFDHKLGEVAGKVLLKTTVQSDLYYLSQETLETLIKKQKSEAQNITDISIIESSGNFQAGGKDITIKIFFTYEKSFDLDKGHISQVLSKNDDFEAATSQIRQEYPNVKTIRKQELGLQVPGIPSRTDISVIDQSQK